jgi:hypothetical protein
MFFGEKMFEKSGKNPEIDKISDKEANVEKKKNDIITRIIKNI